MVAEGRPTRTRPRHYDCCKAWDDLGGDRRARWDWQVIHQLSHSRIPFSATTFAERANVDEDRALFLIREAKRLKWLFSGDPGTWFGRLPRR